MPEVQLEIRPTAADQVRRLMAGQTNGVAVRVYAQPGGGGCCGGGSAVQFGMAFAKPRRDDEVVKVDGFQVIVDPTSIPFVNGAVIDYVETLEESGFKITNPTLPEPDAAGLQGGCTSCGSNSANGGGCGCG
ncbi:MAG TPA: iron-sulfur cluster assembly accessory protein [Thermoplasmata archaeon]|nr:iron-sulfur cluster assembly accessory protein [Thermoplasmata archaeon]